LKSENIHDEIVENEIPGELWEDFMFENNDFNFKLNVNVVSQKCDFEDKGGSF
jgi:hypothetical protein